VICSEKESRAVEVGLGYLGEAATGCGVLLKISNERSRADKICVLFPSSNVRSSGGLWSPFPPSPPLFPRRSSAGERAGLDGVNHSSDNGSCRTCASDLRGIKVCRAEAGSFSNWSCQWEFRKRLLQGSSDLVLVEDRSFRIEPKVRIIYGDMDA
jgi:hypothetical protein